MKSLLKYIGLLTIAATTLVLTACGGSSFDVTLDNGSHVIIETDSIEITNQELLEMIATSGVGLNMANSTILDWADYIMLADLVEIDESQITMQVEMVQMGLSDAEFAELLLVHGFVDLDAYIREVRLGLMRQQAVTDAIEIDEDEIIEIYNEWFAVDPDDNDDAYGESDADNDGEEDGDYEDSEVETDEDDEDADEYEEAPLTFEDVRDDIEAWLIDERLNDQSFGQETLANIRYEAGLVIHSSYLTDNYETFLELWEVEDINVNSSTNHGTAIATLGDAQLTVDELFEQLVARFALTGNSAAMSYIDLNILDQTFDVDHDDVRENINVAMRNMMGLFYPQMEMMGLTTEREIFDHFLLMLLQEVAFESADFQPDEARVQELYENYVPHRSVFHILVETYDEATEMIDELQEIDNNDLLVERFAELAFDHSLCDSSFSGGFLGSLTIPSRMVEEFEVAAFALEEDTFTTEPVLTEFGYHIIFVNEFSEGLTLEEHREFEIARLQMNPEHFTHFMIGLRAEHHLTFHHELLQIQYDAIVRQNEEALNQ
ncbi:MAG: peptidylprolyl isomerase [Turicibacter sp.]|nr:peptidylprolyl isomerase [Turicibacter sp.]